MSGSFLCSVIIPCYNEAARLPGYLSEIVDRLRQTAQPIHVIVADDGSEQAQFAKISSVVAELQPKVPSPHRLSVHRFNINRGKGAVLKDLFLSERELSRLLAFSDADGATPFSELIRLISIAEGRTSAAGILGSRWKALGYNVARSAKRHYIGRVFATLLSSLFNIPIYDSQCGAKVFRSEVLTPEFLSRCKDPKWLFDTELVVMLYRSGLQLLEVPIDWEDKAGSKVSILRDSLRMLIGLVKFRLRLGR